ncbi:MAG: hypothetical protein IJJ01_05635 [Firmicutes bacterium]|nr:hypothetical protein [Bacillota bacterium]
MKKVQRIAVLVLSACLVFGMMTVSAFGDDGYKHQLEVTAGNGSFSSGSTLKGTTASIDIDNAQLTVGDDTVDITAPDENHFVIGMKVTGHDNSEVITGTVDLANYNEDESLVVAYGLKSNMIKYTIRYITADGSTVLHKQEEHYGVVGQKPVVAYKYVEGYLPDAYNRTGELKRGSDNVFTFYYYPVDNAGQIITVQDGNIVINGNAAANANAANAAAGNAAGNANAAANIGDGAVPLANAPANTVDIDDSDTPLANPDEEEGGGGSALPYIIGGVAVAAIIAAIAAFLARRRAGEEE